MSILMSVSESRCVGRKEFDQNVAATSGSITDTPAGDELYFFSR